MHKMISSKTVPATRVLAEDFATMRETPGERKLSEKRVQFLRNKFDDGIFHSPTWAAATLDGVRYRINGQHSSNMLLQLNGHFPEGLPINMIEFQCETLSDLADLFSQFDAKDSARTTAEIITSHGRIHPELAKVSATDMSRAVSGLAWVLNVSKRVGSDERAKLLHDHQAFVLWVHPFIGSPKIKRAPVVGAAHDTWLKDSLAATQFWTLVRDEDHPDVNHPSRVLATFLRDSIVSDRATKASMRFTPDSFYVKCVHAWNAFRTNQRTALKVYGTGHRPKLV